MLILSPNPCFDAQFWVKDLIPGSVVRSLENTYTPGGKGLNVAKVATTMGNTNFRLLVMLPKVEGSLFKELLAPEKYDVTYLDIEGGIRKAILVNKENSLENTVIVGKGPDMQNGDWDRYLSLVKELVRPGEIVVEMGSLASNYPSNAIEELAKIVHDKGAKLLVDTSPACFKTRGNSVLDFITPNLDEAEALINNTSGDVYVVDDTDIEKRAMAAAEKLYGTVAHTVMITTGKHGIALKTEKEHLWIPAYTVSDSAFKSSVGAGDSFVAGFVTYLEQNPGEFESAIRFGMSTAAAQCETFEPGNLKKDRALEIFKAGRA